MLKDFLVHGRKSAAEAIRKMREEKAKEAKRSRNKKDLKGETTAEEREAGQSLPRQNMSMQRMSTPRGGEPKASAKPKRKKAKRKTTRVINLKSAPRVVKKDSPPPRIIDKRKRSIQIKLDPDDYVIDSNGRVILPKGFPTK